MFFNDHNPPHFHVEYGEYKAVVDFKNGVVHGNMPTRALKLIFEWMELHQPELADNWMKARRGEPLQKIEPLN